MTKRATGTARKDAEALDAPAREFQETRLQIAKEFGPQALAALDAVMDAGRLGTHLPVRSSLVAAGFLAGARFAEFNVSHSEDVDFAPFRAAAERDDASRDVPPVPVGDAAALALVGTSLGCLNLGLKVLEALIDATHAKGDRK